MSAASEKCKTCGHPLSQHVGSDCRICYADGGPCVSGAAKDFRVLGTSAQWLRGGREYRFTRLAEAAAQAVTAHPDYREGDKMAIIIDHDDDTPGALTGGLASQGFDGPGDLFVTLMEHARAVIESTGKGHVAIEEDGDEYVLRLVLTEHEDQVKADFAAAFLKGGS